MLDLAAAAAASAAVTSKPAGRNPSFPFNYVTLGGRWSSEWQGENDAPLLVRPPTNDVGTALYEVSGVNYCHRRIRQAR